jgi:hypothetical protein
MGIRSRLGLVIALLAGTIGALAPATALAAPPPNDDRQDAQAVASLPATADGTTVEATREETEPASGCVSAERGTVWYRVTPGRAGRVILGMAANGDLDAVVDVYRVRRSQLLPVTCVLTDEEGRAELDFPVGEDDVFLIRVAPLANSVDDSFRLNLQLADQDATPPGTPLARNGSTGTLNGVLNPSDAYSVELAEGVTYRFNLASRRCTQLSVYPPGTKTFARRPVAGAGCGGYTQFTPSAGQGGVYTLLAATGRRGNTPYRLTAARAGGDDTAPGHFIRNYARVKGELNANRIDVIDLYRFDVERRSDLNIRLESDSNYRLTVLRAGGKRVASSPSGVRAQVEAGRYFALVRAARGARGGYTLRRISRTITATRTTWNGKGAEKVEPGDPVALEAQIKPGVPGPVAVRVQRYDPVYGWQFYRSFRRPAARDGRSVIAFDPPSVGRFRARTFFVGTRGASPSTSEYAYLSVQRPLEQ